ncbi:putative MarR-family transcriptional regulator [Frankia sp. AiPs1]|uniref:MarR family winged helix-turn-helix transcriptional regulator n=1 Tax=Frankia sp. AiPa1 TaxID=573492 RepID=UPI00202B2B1D|nr:MarR family transcriptional regulator [Frankia sp. AiPa1]MCL9758353.1 MarR family transcriptional regulator [Frankia sp. AiPa1]
MVIEDMVGASSETDTVWVDVRGMRAWRALLQAHAHVTRVLEAELDKSHDLPLASYDVLVQLAEAPGRELRMSELADAVLLSRSGLTRLVDRLAREGLVTRRSCPSDARGTLAVLTPQGLDRLRSASGTHLKGVGRHVLSHFSRAEQEQLAELLERLGPSRPPQRGEQGCGQGV